MSYPIWRAKVFQVLDEMVERHGESIKEMVREWASERGLVVAAKVKCPECQSYSVMSDTPLRGVCNACGFAWDNRPGGFASDRDHLNACDEETEYGPCKECGYPRTRSGLCPKCD